MGFFYSFTQMLLHSLWQSGLLLMLYCCIEPFLKHAHPLHKRNFLYCLPAIQSVASLVSFCAYYFSGIVSSKFSLLQNIPYTGSLFAHGDTVFYAYAILLFAHAMNVFNRRRKFNLLIKHSLIRPAAELKLFTAVKAYHLGITKKVNIWYSKKIHTPLTFGFLKPVILLPFSLVNAVSSAEAEAIILHELAHIKNHDYLLNWLLVTAETIYFFNPFIKIIARNIRLEQEKNCDLQVINFNYPGLMYAEALLKAARHSSTFDNLQIAAVKRTPELLRRIQFFSSENHISSRPYRIGIAAACCLPIFIAAAMLFLPGTKKSSSPVAEISYHSQKEINAAKFYAAAPPAYHQVKTSKTLSAQPDLQRVKQVSTDLIDEHNDDAKAFTGSVMHAGFNETRDSVKEFIYKVETPQGKITQSFRMTLLLGQWNMELQWMIIETKADSLRKIQRDTIVNAVPAVQ